MADGALSDSRRRMMAHARYTPVGPTVATMTSVAADRRIVRCPVGRADVGVPTVIIAAAKKAGAPHHVHMNNVLTVRRKDRCPWRYAGKELIVRE